MPSSEDYLIKIQLQIQNDKALKALTTQLDNTAKAAPRAEKAMRNATAGTKKFGYVAQNAGYQIQDFVVQVQGGTDPMRAMSQQLPQMLVGFGAWGAAIGVVTALLPTLIKLTDDSEASMESFSDSLGDVDAAISSFTDTANGLDFNSWNESWNSASAAVKETEIALLEFRNAAAQGRIDEALRAFKTEQAEATGETWGQTFLNGVYAVIGGTAPRDGERATQNLAASLGIDQVSTVLLQEVIQQFEQGAIDLKTFRDQLVEIGSSTPNVSSELSSLIEDINSLANSTDRLSESTKQAASARTALVTGGSLPTGNGGSVSAPAAGGGISAAQQAAIDLNDYNQMLIEAQLGQEAFNATLAQSPEAFSIADAALATFDRTFETMLNGVLMGTQSLADGFRDMSKVIIAELLKLAAYQFVANSFGISLGGVTPSAKGNVFSDGNVIPFAKGGIVNTPTIFPMANGAGLMGEAGPEAIMPLSRGTNGKLGVEAAPVNVVINNNAPGVSVRQRQTDEGLTLDVVMDQVSAAIAKGGNSVSNAMENTYSLGRGRAVY